MKTENLARSYQENVCNSDRDYVMISHDPETRDIIFFSTWCILNNQHVAPTLHNRTF